MWILSQIQQDVMCPNEKFNDVSKPSNGFVHNPCLFLHLIVQVLFMHKKFHIIFSLSTLPIFVVPKILESISLTMHWYVYHLVVLWFHPFDK